MPKKNAHSFRGTTIRRFLLKSDYRICIILMVTIIITVIITIVDLSHMMAMKYKHRIDPALITGVIDCCDFSFGLEDLK